MAQQEVTELQQLYKNMCIVTNCCMKRNLREVFSSHKHLGSESFPTYREILIQHHQGWQTLQEKLIYDQSQQYP